MHLFKPLTFITVDNVLSGASPTIFNTAMNYQIAALQTPLEQQLQLQQTSPRFSFVVKFV